MLEMNTNKREEKINKLTKRIGIGIIALLTIMTLIKAIDLIGSKQAPSDNVINKEGISINELEYLHSMANTVIIAKDKWGNIEINKDTIETALKIAKNSDDKVINNYVEKWARGEFSYSVDFHNYLWRELNGTIGRASGLNEMEIKNIKNRLN